jgi:hypothetical protein
MIVINSLDQISQKSDLNQFIDTEHQLSAQEINLIVSVLKDVRSKSQKHVFLTQQEYDALVSSGQIEPDTLYNIYEEE